MICSDCGVTLSPADRFCGECGGAPQSPSTDPAVLAHYAAVLAEFAEDGVLEDWEAEELRRLRVEGGISQEAHLALMAKHQPLKEQFPLVLQLDDSTLSGFVEGSQGVVRARLRNAGQRPLKGLVARHAVSGEAGLREHLVRSLPPGKDDIFAMVVLLRRPGQYLLETVIQAEDFSGKVQRYRADPMGFRVGAAVGPSPNNVTLNIDASRSAAIFDGLGGGLAGATGAVGGAMNDAQWRDIGLRLVTEDEWTQWAVQRDPNARARAEAEAKARAEAEANERAAARAKAEAEAKDRAEAEARERAAARARTEAEAKARTDAEAREHAAARARTEAEAKARTEADARAKAEEKSRMKAESDARAKADADAKAVEKARADARADAQARAKAEDQARTKTEAAARAKVEADAKAAAEARALAAAPALAAALAARIKKAVAAYPSSTNLSTVAERVDLGLIRKSGELVVAWHGRLESLSTELEAAFEAASTRAATTEAERRAGRLLLVDPAGGGDCRTLAEAVERIPAGGRIEIAAGTYRERIRTNKAIQIEGRGEVVWGYPRGADLEASGAEGKTLDAQLESEWNATCSRMKADLETRYPWWTPIGWTRRTMAPPPMEIVKSLRGLLLLSLAVALLLLVLAFCVEGFRVGFSEALTWARWPGSALCGLAATTLMLTIFMRHCFSLDDDMPTWWPSRVMLILTIGIGTLQVVRLGFFAGLESTIVTWLPIQLLAMLVILYVEMSLEAFGNSAQLKYTTHPEYTSLAKAYNEKKAALRIAASSRLTPGGDLPLVAIDLGSAHQSHQLVSVTHLRFLGDANWGNTPVLEIRAADAREVQVQVTDCWFANGDLYGPSIQLSGSGIQAHLEDVRIRAGRNGVVSHDATVQISRLSVTGSKATAVYQNGGSLQARGCRVEGVSVGFRARDARVDIEHCEFLSGLHGAAWYGKTRGAIRASTIRGMTSRAITRVGDDAAVVTENLKETDVDLDTKKTEEANWALAPKVVEWRDPAYDCFAALGESSVSYWASATNITTKEAEGALAALRSNRPEVP